MTRSAFGARRRLRAPPGRRAPRELPGGVARVGRRGQLRGVQARVARGLSHAPGGVRPVVSSESAISCGTARTFDFTPMHPGDHAYRSGMLRWDVPQGMWGIMRVV